MNCGKSIVPRYLKTLIIIVLAMTSQSNSVMAQGFSANLKVNHIVNGSQNTDGGNSIVVDGSNVYLLWQDMAGTYFSYVSKSTDGGTTFGNGVKIGGNDAQLFGSITTDYAGSIYAAWDGLSGENVNGVYFAKSTNQAQTFTAPITVSSDGLFPHVGVYGNNVYIFFMKIKSANSYGCFFARSTDGGATFSAPYEFSDAVIDEVKFDTPSSLFIDSSGNIYCTWNDGRRAGTGTDIYVAKSTNSGSSFGTNVIVNSISGVSGKIRTGPSVGVSGSNVYIAWRQEDDNQGSNRKIIFSKSTNGGSTFGSEIELASGGWGSPTLKLNSLGEIYIAYPQYTVEKDGLFCTKSNDQGNTFPVTVFISSVNAKAQNPSIFVDGNDMVYTVWTAALPGNDEVYFSKGKITITDINDSDTFIPAEYKLYTNYPNPFNPSTSIVFSIPEISDVTLKVYDLLGREIKTLVNGKKSPGTYEIKFSGTDLSTGVYLYKIQAGKFVQTRKMLLLK